MDGAQERPGITMALCKLKIQKQHPIFRRVFKYSFLCSSGFLIMFIPKCSFLPYFKTELDQKTVRTFHRVLVDDLQDDLRDLDCIDLDHESEDF